MHLGLQPGGCSASMQTIPLYKLSVEGLSIGRGEKC